MPGKDNFENANNKKRKRKKNKNKFNRISRVKLLVRKKYVLRQKKKEIIRTLTDKTAY